ncbi:hypothetical protein RIVM261_050330 [Rivularia sp. IAM M-261]|nr:hypothetical protein RIVM261_050330 [Rivularia sp. IAM M-261]
MARLEMHFNGTFALKREEVSRILKAASEEKALDDTLKDLADRTSLGGPKVGKIKSWAERSGLVKGKHLTSEGELVWKLDPYLELYITYWLMHFYLSFGSKGLQKPPNQTYDWGGWSYFVYSFLPQNKVFTATDLLNSGGAIFEEKSDVISQRFSFILRAYTESQALASCGFLTKQGEKYYAYNNNLDNYYLIGYFLAKLWERDFGATTSVLTHDILNQKMGLAPVLGVDASTLQRYLNEMGTLEIIEHRRTVSPAQIIRRWDDPMTLLEKAYANQ